MPHFQDNGADAEKKVPAAQHEVYFSSDNSF